MKKTAPPELKWLRYVEQVDWSLFCLSQIQKQEENKKPRSPIEIMVDDVTGYKLSQDKETIEAVLYQLRRIVRYKNKLNNECGCSHSTEETRKNILALQKILKTIVSSQKVE